MYNYILIYEIQDDFVYISGIFNSKKFQKKEKIKEKDKNIDLKAANQKNYSCNL